MSYTALYRKWRSQTFDEVKGQEPITESFKNQIRTGRIGHAYLFTGTRGTGKTSVAKILARAVNCENPVNGNPCNECASCRAILNGSSMNVIEMDAASNNGVEDIRDIRDKIEYPPAGGKYKVYIIDEVHMLSTSAFNAFLKTLEEPPEYVIFVLATTEPNKIPITILSRCQRYDFRRISTDVIADRLREISDAEKINVSDEALHYIARVGDGSMRDSVSLLDQCSAFRFDRKIEYEDALDILGAVDTGIFSDLIRALAARDIRTVLTKVSDMVSQGRELSQFVSDFLFYIRNLLMAKTVKDVAGLVDMSSDNLQRLMEDAELLSIDELMRYVRMLSELSNQLRYATEKRVLIETTLMKLAFTETDLQPDTINARISELERKMQSVSAEAIAGLQAMNGGPGAFAGAAGMAGSVLASANAAGMTGGGSGGAGASYQNAAALRGANAADLLHPGEGGRSQTVRLPKAQYEDLQLLKKEWKNLGALMSDGLKKSAIQNSWVSPLKGEAGMVIVTTSKASYNTISEEQTLAEIRRVVSEKYHKEISFKAKFADNTDSRTTVYVTDEDLKSKINMPVDIETEDSEEE